MKTQYIGVSERVNTKCCACVKIVQSKVRALANSIQILKIGEKCQNLLTRFVDLNVFFITREIPQAMADLEQIVKTTSLGIADSSRKSNRIIRHLLSQSTTLNRPNFDRLCDEDLEFLFYQIDNEFFGNQIARSLKRLQLPLTFRVSKRMTNSGGITSTKFDRKNKPKEFEIAISSTLLFESFKDNKPIVVTGLLCGDRAHALARIMEHEMIHLIEMLLWNESSCAKARFQNIAFRLFRHRQSTHQLLTPSDTAESNYDISAGDWVQFELNRKTVMGFVNRITKRATVLVPSREGTRYADGKKYLKYYVPIRHLRKAV